MPLQFTIGDATQPPGVANRIIAHVCNDAGVWGAGFVLAVSRRWRKPEVAYRQWANNPHTFQLGEVQLVKVEPHLWVANLIAQHGVGHVHGIPPIRYDSLRRCLDCLSAHASGLEASVHMPRIGCGLAGGSWPVVEELIRDTLLYNGVNVTVYDLPEPPNAKAVPAETPRLTPQYQPLGGSRPLDDQSGMLR